MSACTDFAEISVLIPGYSIEDLPTDLPEDSAASLLNAIACAWHPRLIQMSAGIPLFRQADSLSGFPGRRIILVPTPSESWMPHEWRAAMQDQGHVVIAGCSAREEWVASIESALDAHCSASEIDSGSQVRSSADELPPVASESSEFASAAAPSGGQDRSLLAHFFALGTVIVQTQLLSRRRHHFVDPDNLLLGREIRAAAEAWATGQNEIAKLHLRACFEHLRETRERFFPMNCFLIDICLPSDMESVAAVRDVIQSVDHLNLFATGRELESWVQADASLEETIKSRVADGTLCLLTGHDVETRVSLGSMAATVADIARCRETVLKITGAPPRHWARRRFGLTASLPALLQFFGFESALHVALDDGLYPDRERSQFDWQGTDGAIIAAASRIPLAIDSASGFLRFADRFNESMQDDTTAALFLARLPTLKSPWLDDLRIATDYAPVLGEFVTMERLCHAAGGTRIAERNSHADYLSPFLIQSSVLGTESPVSGPARLRQLQQQLESLRTLLAVAALVRAPGGTSEAASQIHQADRDLGTLESRHVDVLDASADRSQALLESARKISDSLEAGESGLSRLIHGRIPSRQANSQGLFLINTVPFSRFVRVSWPSGWRRPARSASIELAERTESAERLLVRLPPGGFVWLTEANAEDRVSQAPHPLMEPVRNEPALAESLTLRNRHFEVSLNERSGGIASVTWHNQRGNRLSQQACFRFERELTLPDDGSGEIRKAVYGVLRMTGHRVTEAGTVFAAVETVSELVSPADQSVLAVVRQTVSLDRVQPRICVELSFENIQVRVKGNPWLCYFGCRFAWDNETAAISRAVMGQVAGFRSERFESPDYLEVSDDHHRLVIAVHGSAYHRRSGPGMLDTILIPEGEKLSSFRFTIDFDQSFPFRTASDVLTPAIVLKTADSVPESVAEGWILGLSARNVELVRTDYKPSDSEQSEELTLLLSETDGQPVRCLVRTARRPVSAFLVNADRTEKSALEITEQGVLVCFDAFQIKCVLLML